MDKVFKIEDLRPIRDEMTVSRNSRLSDKTPITYFSLGKGSQSLRNPTIIPLYTSVQKDALIFLSELMLQSIPYQKVICW